MDCAQLEKFLEVNGIEVVQEPSSADVIFFYACGLTEKDARISLDVIRELKGEKREEAELIVWGCLPHIDPRALRKVYKGPVYSRSNIGLIGEVIDSRVDYSEVYVNHLYPVDPRRRKTQENMSRATSFLEWLNYRLRSRFAPIVSSEMFYIMTGRGCLGNCTFCSDLRACGRIRSKPKEQVVREFKEGLRKGYKVFNLVATDLGAYGRDLGYRLDDLLREIIKLDGDYKLVLGNVNPYHLNEMYDNLLEVFNSGRVALLGSSVQSGSNRLLKLMGRRYTVEEFKKCIKGIKHFSPRTLFWTQIMVGFPSETEEDFKQTLELLDEVKFDFIQVFKFSTRPTIPAARFSGQVPQEVVEKRYRRILMKAILNEFSRKIERALS